MSDRALIVLALVIVVAVVVLITRYWPAPRRKMVAVTGLEPGCYLLTSAGCSSCDAARSRLGRRLPDFTELTWQTDPEVFERLGIDAVPSVLAVGADGSGEWWRGGVPRRLPLVPTS